jgi:D-alanine-D-alanine ligase
VTTSRSSTPAVELALRHDPRVIVEASAERPRDRVLGPRQRRARGLAARGRSSALGDWYDFEAKYTEGGMELRVPAPIGS